MDEDSFSSECMSVDSEILDTSLDSAGSIDSLTSDCIDSSGDSTTDDEVQVEDDSFSRPLYEGAKLSVFESYLSLLQYSLRHGLTKQASSDLLNLVGKHLPTESMISLHMLKKFFQEKYGDLTFQSHYCCSCCHSPLSDENSTCPSGCDMPAPTQFLSVPLEAQLVRRLEDHTIWNHLQKSKKDNGNKLEDIHDGKEYKKHEHFVSQPGNITLTVNTDGVSIFKSANISLWPVWLAINELPPHVRFSKNHLLLAGLWQAKSKPTMTTYLRPLIDEVNKLSAEGFSIKTPTGVITAHARLLLCTVDLPARALVLNIKQFNGKNGCSYCEDEGEPRASNHLHRNWPYTRTSISRSHHSIMTNARDAIDKNVPQMGIKGASILCMHKPFDLCAGTTVDVMHCVFLGVMAKTLTTFWFGVSHRLKPFSVRRKMSECNNRLRRILVPHDFSRAARSLDDIKHWKASEYRSWVLYFSLPVLNGLLPEPYYTHYTLLVAAVHILLSSSITQSALKRAEVCLEKFCEKFAALYGVNGCTMNVHMLRHLPQCVVNWGPLWAYSCFPFESVNGHLKRHFHGTRAMNTQLAFSYLILQAIPKQENRSQSKRLTLVDCSVIGDIEMVHLSLEVQEALRRDCGVEAIKVSRFLRASVKHVELYSFEYKRLKTRNSYTVLYRENEEDKFGLIQYFLSLPAQSVAVVKRLNPTNNYCYSHQLRELQQRIIPVAVETGIHVVPVKSIITKCVYLDLESSKYVARLANDFFEF